MTSLRSIFVLFTAGLLSWTSAQELTLSEAWNLALENSPTEDLARARLEQAEARLGQRRSEWHPRLDGRASAQRFEQRDALLQTIGDVDDTSETFRAAIDASWALYTGGSRQALIDAAKKDRDGFLADTQEIRLALLAEVGGAFTSAQLARENVRIARADAAFQKRQSEDARLREEAGAVSKADRLNFDLRTLEAETAAIQAKASYDQSMAALSTLIGLGAIRTALPSPVGLDQLPEAVPVPDADQAWEATRSTLPVLIAAQNRVNAAAQRVEAVQGEYLPRVEAFANLTAEREDDADFSEDDLSNLVGIRVSLPLWDGFRRRESVSEARAQLNELNAQRHQVELQAEADLQNALTVYQASVEAETLTRESLEISRTTRNLVELSYQAGQESLIRLNEAQRDFITAEANAARAKLSRQLSWIDVQRAMGTLSQNLSSL